MNQVDLLPFAIETNWYFETLQAHWTKPWANRAVTPFQAQYRNSLSPISVFPSLSLSLSRSLSLPLNVSPSRTFSFCLSHSLSPLGLSSLLNKKNRRLIVDSLIECITPILIRMNHSWDNHQLKRCIYFVVHLLFYNSVLFIRMNPLTERNIVIASSISFLWLRHRSILLREPPLASCA
jgi:hypothetical protein